MAIHDNKVAIVTGGAQGIGKGIVDVLYVFEMVLCFDAWINQTEYWPSTEIIFTLIAARSLSKR